MSWFSLRPAPSKVWTSKQSENRKCQNMKFNTDFGKIYMRLNRRVSRPLSKQISKIVGRTLAELSGKKILSDIVL